MDKFKAQYIIYEKIYFDINLTRKKLIFKFANLHKKASNACLAFNINLDLLIEIIKEYKI
jgi:hypothetical protein